MKSKIKPEICITDILNSLHLLLSNTQPSEKFLFRIQEIHPINNVQIYSILELSYQITFKQLCKYQYHTNESLFTSGIVYQFKEIKTKRNIKLIKGVTSNENVNRNTLKSHFNKQKSNMSLNSNYQTSKSLFDDNSKSRLNPRRRKYLNSDEDLKISQSKTKFQENKRDRFLQNITLEKINLEDNFPVQEENEKSFNSGNLIETQFLCKNRLSCNKYNLYNKSRNDAIAYSTKVRNQYVKLVSNNKRYLTIKLNEIKNYKNPNETVLNRRTKHNKSFMNYLNENTDETKTNRENFIINQKQVNLNNKRNSNSFFTIDMKTLSKLSPSIQSNSLKNYSNKKRNHNTNSTPTNKMTFIFAFENLVEVSPHYQTQTIKAILQQQKRKEKRKLTRQEVNNHSKGIPFTNSLSPTPLIKSDVSEYSDCSEQ